MQRWYRMMSTERTALPKHTDQVFLVLPQLQSHLRWAGLKTQCQAEEVGVTWFPPKAKSLQSAHQVRKSLPQCHKATTLAPLAISSGQSMHKQNLTPKRTSNVVEVQQIKTFKLKSSQRAETSRSSIKVSTRLSRLVLLQPSMFINNIRAEKQDLNLLTPNSKRQTWAT